MSHGISRRGLVIGSATALGTMSLGRHVFAQDFGPIRIGLLAPLTGFAPDLGRDVKIGAEIAVEQLNKAGGVMGRPIDSSCATTRSTRTKPSPPCGSCPASA